MTHAPQQVNPRFSAALAREYMQARIERRLACPLHPEATVEVDGDVYAVEQQEVGGFDTMSGKARWTIVLTQHRTGRAVTFANCWWKQIRAKDGTVKQKYTSPAGKHSTWTDMAEALAALAAGQLTEQGVAA